MPSRCCGRWPTRCSRTERAEPGSERLCGPDRPWKQNQELAAKIRADWPGGKPDPAHTTELLATLRTGSAAEASEKVVELLNAGIAPESIWAALFDGAGELMMRDPNIRSLHAVTTTNAMHFAFGQTASDNTKRLLLLQNAAFIPLFRGNPKTKGVAIDQLEPLSPKKSGSEAVAEILADISHDRQTAARKVLAYAKDNPMPKELIDAARLMIFFKGRDAHDYKFSSAVMEDYAAM